MLVLGRLGHGGSCGGRCNVLLRNLRLLKFLLFLLEQLLLLLRVQRLWRWLVPRRLLLLVLPACGGRSLHAGVLHRGTMGRCGRVRNSGSCLLRCDLGRRWSSHLSFLSWAVRLLQSSEAVLECGRRARSIQLQWHLCEKTRKCTCENSDKVDVADESNKRERKTRRERMKLLTWPWWGFSLTSSRRPSLAASSASRSPDPRQWMPRSPRQLPRYACAVSCSGQLR